MGAKTEELDAILANPTGKGSIEKVLKENQDKMLTSDRNFYDYVKSVIKQKGIKMKDLYLAADMSEKYCGKVIRMEKHADTREQIIRICLAAHFNLEETNRALFLYGLQPLYSRIPRDAVIILAINRRIYDVWDVSDLLEQQGFQGFFKE